MDFGGFFRERRFHESRTAIQGYKALRSVASRLGLHVVLKTFYSPIPELERLPPGWFERVSELPGIELDLDRQLAFLRERLAGPMAEFAPTENPSYSRLDATLLYGMVRAHKPRRIVELGSGHSTLVMAQAVRRNAAEGAAARLEVYDPYASLVTADLPGLERLQAVAAQQVPLSAFEALQDGDVLFVDTTHTVKTGSDVNFIVLEVLPRLAAGVIVHVHDIFLPFEYPKGFLESFGLYWTEQYLLQAFLVMNPGYEILLAGAALEALRRPEVASALPPGVPAQGASAFWIRRTAGGR